MSSIWHFPSEAPAYCFLCVFENSFDGEVHCGHYNPVKKQFCSTEGRYEINQVKKYCDLLHLLDCEQELIHTRKALGVALCSLQDIAESNGDFITGASTPLDEHEYADMMLKEIKRQMKIKTALEQKD